MQNEIGPSPYTVPKWRTVFGTVRGTSHAYANAPCQDAAEVLVQTIGGESIAILASADGAGSAPLSHEGSQLACAAIVGEVADYLDGKTLAAVTREVAEMWFARVHVAISERASELGRPVRDLACTLLLAVIGDDRAVFAQIGDGAIVIDNGAQGYAAATWPQSGEYANTTYFATEHEALRHLQLVFMDNRKVDEVALFSDGIEKLALRFHDRSVHDPFFAPLFGRLRPLTADGAMELQPQLLAFLDSPAVNARTDDDKTLVLATRRASTGDTK